MKQTKTTLNEIQLVGITARTNNAAEMNPASAKIGETIHKFFINNITSKIQNRKTPGTTYCVYTDYESDFNGDYTYFVGEEVSTAENIPKDLSHITIPAQDYVKYTTDPGKMREVVINMWKKIWQATEDDLGGERAYLADFEIYDERSSDPANSVVDIYIGIKKG